MLRKTDIERGSESDGEKVYRASIREDPDSENEFGNRINYAHLQTADKFGNWGPDIATKEPEDLILIRLKDFAGKARERAASKSYDKQKVYDRSIPYKFYDTEAFAAPENGSTVVGKLCVSAFNDKTESNSFSA